MLGGLLTLFAGRWALAADGPKEIALSIEGNRFAPAEITVVAGTPFVLVITNRDRTAEEFESRDLRIEKVVPAGKTVRVRVAALKKGAYAFFGEFHQTTAQGRIIAE
jgi:plastocyanin domain-containing protein